MKLIIPIELKQKLDDDEVLLIDVRETIEHQDGYIDGSCLIPLGEISIERLPSNKGPIVIYCRSGKRSVDACIKLSEMDPSLDLYSLDGGIIAWEQAGYSKLKLN